MCAGPEIFLRFETDLNFSRPWFIEIKVQIKRLMVNCVADKIRVNLNPVIHMPHMKTSQLPKLLKTYHENWNYTTFFDTFHMMMVNCVTEEIRVNLGPLIFRRRNCFLHYLSLGIWGRKRNSFPSWTGKRMWHTWMCMIEQALFPIS